MPVGDEEGLAAEVAEQPVIGLDGGQLVKQPVAVSCAPLVGPGARHDVVVALGAIEVEGQDRAELGAGRVEQGQPIGLRTGHGVLVRADPISPGLELDPDHEALDRQLIGRSERGVAVVIGGGRCPAPQRAVAQPRLEGRCGRPMRIRLGAVFEPDRVSLVAGEQRLALGVVDHVVGRADHVADVRQAGRRSIGVLAHPDAVSRLPVAEAVDGVVNAGKRSDAGHAAEDSRGRAECTRRRPPEAGSRAVVRPLMRGVRWFAECSCLHADRAVPCFECLAWLTIGTLNARLA